MQRQSILNSSTSLQVLLDINLVRKEMDKIVKVKQSLQGMLKRMTQETNDEGKIGNNVKHKTLKKTTSLEEKVVVPKISNDRRALSVGVDQIRKKVSVTTDGKGKEERDLIRFSSEEDDTESGALTPNPELLLKQIRQHCPITKKAKSVHFEPKAELSNIKISAPNPLQPPPNEGHCVAQYRLFLTQLR